MEQSRTGRRPIPHEPRIVIDVSSYRAFRRRHGRVTGIERVTFEVVRRLCADDRHVVAGYFDRSRERFIVAESELLDVDIAVADAAPPSSAPRSGRRSPRASWRTWPLVRRLARSRLAWRAVGVARRATSWRSPATIDLAPTDVVMLLGTSWDSPALLDWLNAERDRVGFSVATMVYDLIPVEHPQFALPQTVPQFARYLTQIMTMSDIVFTISEATRRAVRSWCDTNRIAPPPLHVVALGDDFSVPTEVARPPGVPDGSFVLSVSTMEPRKNFMLLYQAVKQGDLDDRALPPIVIVGRAGWKTSDLQELLRTDPSIRHRLVWLDGVSDVELAWLYRNSMFTLFPSIVEGWGLPIAESIHFGRFCLSSGTSSMPEIAGDLIDYLSPFDAAAWARAIHDLAADPALLARKTERLVRGYRPRTWDQTATAIRDLVLPGLPGVVSDRPSTFRAESSD
jgi:glycosyltransferase involved in cell wall biosynthesis